MPQKRNKIIFVIILIVTLIILWQITAHIKRQGNLSSNQISTKEQKISILDQGCLVSEGDIMRVCRYSPLQKAISITKTAKITINNKGVILPVVRSGDLDIFKLNLTPLLSNAKYQDIIPKIGTSFSLCFTFDPPLSHLQTTFPSLVDFISNDVVCTKVLTKNNDLNFGFISTIPIVSQDTQQAMNIDIWRVPASIQSIHSWNEFTHNKANLIPIIRLTPATITY